MRLLHPGVRSTTDIEVMNMCIVSEEWRPVKGFEEFYEVSNLGGVRNSKTLRLVLPQPNHKGYLRVQLYTQPGSRLRKHCRVHRLVAEAFIRDPLPGEQIDHIDGNKQNNCATNLEWVTCHENVKRFHKNRSASQGVVRVAMALVAGGMPIERAAKRVGKGRWWLRDIYRGKTWKHLNLPGRRGDLRSFPDSV